ncbi:glycine zipper family protein [Fictibacillus gelatini]|uniref:glycine zipper family protein n=1 Tax=Fictibacillus gelatini TaxID=225985 RepID=UPI0005536FCA|nr:glycine zipper family protein [Fictibacillus gelatini]
MRKVFCMLAILVNLCAFMMPTVFADSKEDLQTVFNLMEQIERKEDSYTQFIDHVDWTIDYVKDIPEQSINPDVWSEYLEIGDMQGSKEKVAALARMGIWVEQVESASSKLKLFEVEVIGISESEKASLINQYERFKGRIPDYIKSLDLAIQYCDWAISLDESDLKKAHYVSGHTHDWYKRPIYEEVRQRAQFAKDNLLQIEEGYPTTSGTTIVNTQPMEKKESDSGSGLPFVIPLFGFFGGLALSGYLNARKDKTLLYHILKGITTQNRRIKKLAVEGVKQYKATAEAEIEKRKLIKKNLKFLVGASRVIKGAKLALNAYKMYQHIKKEKTSKEDWREFGENITKTIVNSVCVAIGTYLGGELGIAIGGLIGLPTGPGAAATAVALGTAGSVAGGAIGDYVGDYIGDKVARFGGDLFEGLYNYSQKAEGFTSSILKKFIFK